jgi:hypothetical protein
MFIGTWVPDKTHVWDSKPLVVVVTPLANSLSSRINYCALLHLKNGHFTPYTINKNATFFLPEHRTTSSSHTSPEKALKTIINEKTLTRILIGHVTETGLWIRAELVCKIELILDRGHEKASEIHELLLAELAILCYLHGRNASGVLVSGDHPSQPYLAFPLWLYLMLRI